MSKAQKYSVWYILPALTVFTVLFIVPMIISVFFSMTVWSFADFRFVGLQNYKMFFEDSQLLQGLGNTLIYAFSTSMSKVVLALLISIFLTSNIRLRGALRSVVFFPHLVSNVAIGITFCALMHPTKGVFNAVLTSFGLKASKFVYSPNTSLVSVIVTDVWKGLSVSTVIYIAGLQAIDRTYYEAAEIDGASRLQTFWNITLPLVRPAMNTVIILSLIGGLKSFDLIKTMTDGGPGNSSTVLALTVYRQFANGYYGMSTTGNIIMLVMISLISYPLQKFLLSREVSQL
ncbi:MAG: sugar ABC transporter permease [Candidatus Aphodomonas sp.]|nr:sugar ABC transporter permease [Candidatus Aphodomonas sp.]